MVTDGRQLSVLETSVLVNFLAVDRLDILARHPSYRFVLTGHVRAEITEYYADQVQRVELALKGGLFAEVTVDALDPTFVQLTTEGRLGVGECAAIAYAVANNLPLVIDDRKARNTALRIAPVLVLESTETLMVASIKAGILDIPTADAIKADWEANHRFKLAFGSFGEKV